MANNRNDKILKAFGANLKRLRVAKGLTTREFANMANIAYSQVWTLENGKGDPSLTTLVAIAGALDANVGDLIQLDL